jgi:CspA family cold shock protein
MAAERNTRRMTSRGIVRCWHDGDGWGVLDSESTPGGCWAHFSSVLTAGYRALRPGSAVEFGFEVADEDGYSFRATEVWPADVPPVRTREAGSMPSAAYRSTLTTSFDDMPD